MKPSQDFLLQYFPNSNPIPIGSDENNRFQINVFLIQESSTFRPYYVVSEKDGLEFIPKIVSEYPHIPYDLELTNAKPPNSSALGVYVTVEEIYDELAKKIKFRQEAIIRTADVVAHHAVLFDWDTAWLSSKNRPKPVEILLGDTWSPSIAACVAATADEFFRAYSQYYPSKDERSEWAAMSFYETETWEEKLGMVQCIVDRAHENADYLGILAAGPVEDLLNHKLLDHIERDSTNTNKWRSLLKGVYTHGEPLDVAERVKKIIGVSA